MEEDEIFNLTNVLRNIPIEHLKCSPYNKYDLFDMEDMEGSILSVGLLSPLTVIGPDDNGDYYYLSGKRRFTAIQSLNEKGQTDYKEIPCLIKGGMDVPELVQELMAESANIETRDFDKNARRFKVIRILEAMVQDGTLRKSQVRKQAGKYMKVSDRYRSMYLNIFRKGEDGLQDMVGKELPSGRKLSVADADTIASMSKEKQTAAIADLQSGKSVKEVLDTYKTKKKTETSMNLTDRDRSEYSDMLNPYVDSSNNDNCNVSSDYGNINGDSTEDDFNIDDMDTDDLFGMFNDSVFSKINLDVDTTGSIKQLKKDDEKEYKKFLNKVSMWCKRMGRASSYTNDELKVIEDARTMLEAFDKDNVA